MTRRRKHRSAACCALLAAAALSGCGIQVESIAHPALFAIPDTPARVPVVEWSALTPCLPGAGRPHAASAVGDLLLGADRYAIDCARQARPVVRPAPLGVPARVAPATQPASGMVTDELVGAVLTGGNEYWYPPVIGSA